jgi:hypothetical protein
MPSPIRKELIAPCGMNCAVCRGYLRSKNRCEGCRNIDEGKPVSRVNCRLRICNERKNGFCHDCHKFPCLRLKKLDNRYRTQYDMSVIENLEYIRDNGIRKFLKKENARWINGNEIFCVHDKMYYPLKKDEKNLASKNRG